jgi:branched-chain amino acid transport system substrate-binding protein
MRSKWILGLAALCVASASARAAEPMTIDVIVSLTGPGAFLGESEHQALIAQEKVINQAGGIHGHQVTFAYHDDQSSPQTAVQLLSGIRQTNPPFVLGSTLVAACNAMAPMVRNGPLLYCFSSGVHPPAGSNMFVSGASTTDDARDLLVYFRSRGWTKLALITSTDATGQEADQSFKDLLALPENKGIDLLAHEHFDIKDVSVSAQLERIAEAKPQAVIAWATGSPLGTVFRGMVQSGMKLPVGTTAGNATFSQMHQLAGVMPPELYFGIAAWPLGADPKLKLDPAVEAKLKDLYSAFAATGAKPDEGNMLGWDPTTLLVDAMRTLPDGASAKQVHDYMADQQHAPGASGMYDFKSVPQRGLGPEQVIVVRWNAGQSRWDVVSDFGGKPLP